MNTGKHLRATLRAPRRRCFLFSCAFTCLCAVLSQSVLAQIKAPKPGTGYYKKTQEYLKKVRLSESLPCGWVVETPAYVVHSTISKEYTVAAAIHLWRFRDAFQSIFRGEYKDQRKPVAYGFATEAEYLKFSPMSKGTQGRFLGKPQGNTRLKDLAWFSTPPGETDFYKTDITIVQHEATHQLLDAYTDNPKIPKWFHEGCATFFETWDADRKNQENILSGLNSNYALGICLTYPDQEPAPLLRSYWISPRRLLNLDIEYRPEFTPIQVQPPGAKKDLFDFKAQMTQQQEYNESWCALTFFVDHKKGQEIFKLLVKRFHEGASLADIRKQYYDETFLGSFEKEWCKFIETKVLVKWELPTVG
jgi:hypothetical protein